MHTDAHVGSHFSQFEGASTGGEDLSRLHMNPSPRCLRRDRRAPLAIASITRLKPEPRMWRAPRRPRCARNKPETSRATIFVEFSRGADVGQECSIQLDRMQLSVLTMGDLHWPVSCKLYVRGNRVGFATKSGPQG